MMICAVALLAAMPGIASARSDRAQARLDAIKTCKQQRNAAGKKNFAQLWGKNAYGKCVSRESHENRVEAAQATQDAHANAAKECKTEQAQAAEQFSAAHGGKTFAQQYGTNGNGKNAYGKCVSRHARENQQQEEALNAEQDQNQVNAAKQCKAERNDPNFATAEGHDGKSFADYYGTNANKKNAFGKCVSKKARAMNQHDEQQQEQQQQSSS